MDLSFVKRLREESGCSIMACKEALEDAKGDLAKAREHLKKNYQETFVSQKRQRETLKGIIASYVHTTKRVGGLIELHCETDFVANTKEFQVLALELALQVVGMNPKNKKELLLQPYVRDPVKKVKDLVNDAIGKLGENITIARFTRYEL